MGIHAANLIRNKLQVREAFVQVTEHYSCTQSQDIVLLIEHKMRPLPSRVRVVSSIFVLDETVKGERIAAVMPCGTAVRGKSMTTTRSGSVGNTQMATFVLHVVKNCVVVIVAVSIQERIFDGRNVQIRPNVGVVFSVRKNIQVVLRCEGSQVRNPWISDTVPPESVETAVCIDNGGKVEVSTFRKNWYHLRRTPGSVERFGV